MDVITFGQREQNQHYITRPAVYAVMRDSQTGTIAVIQKGTVSCFFQVAVSRTMSRMKTVLKER